MTAFRPSYECYEEAVTPMMHLRPSYAVRIKGLNGWAHHSVKFFVELKCLKGNFVNCFKFTVAIFRYQQGIKNFVYYIMKTGLRLNINSTWKEPLQFINAVACREADVAMQERHLGVNENSVSVCSCCSNQYNSLFQK